jgi:hypothetical protein
VKRVTGFYWVELVRWRGVPIVAHWNGVEWAFAARSYPLLSPRVRKVLSGRLNPPGSFEIRLPVERVLLDSGKGYREELNVDRVNHATGAVYVSRKAKP